MSFNIKIANKKAKIQIPLANPIIDLKRLLQRILKKKATKCHNTPGDNDSGSYYINFSYHGRGKPEEWLVWKDKSLKVLDSQGNW